VRLLLDTQLMIAVVAQSHRLSTTARSLIEDKNNDVFFSVVSIWEVAIKCSLERNDFTYEPDFMREALLENDFTELEMTAAHAIGVRILPHLHKDPFDRLLIAQAISENILLMTTDRKISAYPGPIRLV
jgi:PIN domain nuclease of toxin-antitoxin system